MIKLAKQTDLYNIRREIYKAWVKASVAERFNGIESLRKHHAHCQQLYGSYLTISRLMGVVNDNDWQNFLEGEGHEEDT